MLVIPKFPKKSKAKFQPKNKVNRNVPFIAFVKHIKQNIPYGFRNNWLAIAYVHPLTIFDILKIFNSF